MKENSQKKVLLSVLGVAILVVAVIGISFALYQTTFNSSNANSIATGTIMVSYTEPTNAINIADALPISDEEGKALSGTNNTFDFSVSTKASNALTVPYVISLTKVADSTLTDDDVKVYLTKDGSPVVEPTKISALSAYSSRGADSKTLYTTQDVYTTTDEPAKTSQYVLRMWIDQDVAVSSDDSKTYKAKVNVDSTVTPVA